MKYTIELNEEQLHVLSRACELYARVQIGQIREALDELPLAYPIDSESWNEDKETIGRIISKHTIDNVDGWRSSLGISNEQTHESAKVSYDIHQAIRHKLSWDRAVQEGKVRNPLETGAYLDPNNDRNWKEMMGVHYDKPMICSKQPLPKIEGEIMSVK